MKRALLLAALALGSSALADDYLTTITSTGASVRYTLSAKSSGRVDHLLVQCDAAAYVKTGDSAVTVSSTDGEKVQGDALPFDVYVAGSDTSVAIISVSGTANCKVWMARPQ